LNIEDIKNRILSDIDDDIDTSEGSFANDIVSGAAYEIAKVYDKIDESLSIFLLETIDGEYAEKRCGEKDVERDPGACSSGLLIFSGEDGTVIPKGFRAEDSNGVGFLTLEEVTIADGSAEVQSIAAEPGENGNVAPGEVMYIKNMINGVKSVTNSEFSGGTEPESDKSMIDRYRYLLKNPPSSGNKSDYIKWATEVDGIADARPVRCADGPGTVKVIVLGEDNSAVPDVTVKLAKDNILNKCPLPPDITVVSVEEIDITVTATVTLESGYYIKDIAEQARVSIDKFFKEFNPEKHDKIYANKIEGFITSLPGVINCTNLKLNDNNTYITMDVSKSPKLNGVNLS